MTKRPETIAAKRKVLKDPASGREVWQATPDGMGCGKGYMYLNHATPDDRYLIVQGATADDLANGDQPLYRLDLEAQEMVKLVDGAGMNWCTWNLHPDGELYYKRDNRISAVAVATGEERLVVDFTGCAAIGGAAGGPIRFSGSGRYLSFAFTHGEDECAAPASWSHWGQVKYRRSGAGRVACAGGEPEIVYLHHEGMQHLMFCPADDELMTFAVWPDYQNNAALADNHRARAWLIDRRRDFARPYLIMPKGRRATHEFWSRAGDRLFYHWKTVPDWAPNGLGFLDRASETRRDFYTDPARRLSHSDATPDGRFIVSGCVEGPGQNELVLVEVDSGRAEIIRCPHQGRPEAMMTAPSITPSGRFIVCASSGSGEPRVYLVPLA